MGQKVNPHGLRVGVIKDWDSRWYARDEKVGDLIVEDYKIREYLKKTLYSAGIPNIEIERDSAKVRIYIHCSRPGVVIGKGGAEIERIRLNVEKMIGKPVALSIVEVRTPDTNAQLVAENIAAQLEKRIGFRRAMKNAMGRAMRMGARGIKIMCSGRLGGAEIARTECYHEGTIPLQTIRADIEYPNDTIAAVMRETADNLCGRFNDSIGAIRSWDFGTWNFPVIIDNMMNLDLLFNVAKATGDNRYKDIAIKHAMTTMHNHFRPDYTCWHVVSYNSDGTVERKQTHQGKNDDSSWARGQAWAVYGYTACFRETNDSIFLNFAKDIADMIMDRVKTDDAIPYWDYDAPVTKETPRDVSAASVTASAMIELSTMVPDGQKYLDYAEKILKSLSSDAYLAKVGDNQGFILMHSVGSLPNGSEIDTPLNYADYYYLEALKRFMDLKGINYKDI